MRMEGLVKCMSPQNTSGVSGVNSVAPESNTEDIRDLSLDEKKTTEKTHNMSPYCSCGVIQVSVSPGIHIRLETRSFTPKSPPEAAFLVVSECTSTEDIRGHLEYECRGLQTFRWHHTSRMEPCYVFFCLKISPWYLQLCSIQLLHCLPLKLQKCFVDSNTSPTLPSAYRGE